MVHPRPDLTSDVSRRAFLSTASGAVASLALAGVAPHADGAEPRPKLGGTLRFSTRLDAGGLDPHRNVIYPVSMPLAATTQGLLDRRGTIEHLVEVNHDGTVVPRLASG